MTTSDSYPRSVTPGIKTQPHENDLPPAGVYVGLDWIRCTGPDELKESLVAFLDESLGTEPRATHGAKWYKHGLAWEPGVILSWGHRNEICQVDIQGSRLRLMDGTDRIDLLRILMDRGLRPTRIDGALDFIDQDLNICTNAESSCERGELCGPRRWSPNNEYRSNGRPTRLLLKLGARSSPVCVRIYDKGLEQKLSPAGHWERLEVEWKKDRAQTVAAKLTDAGDSWPNRLASHILGALDFREDNDRSEIDRRPRLNWWDAVMGDAKTATISPQVAEQTYAKWRDAFVQSYGRRLLEFSRAVGRPVGEIVEILLEGLQPSDSGGLLVTEFARVHEIDMQIDHRR